MKINECVFCKIIKKEAPSHIIYEDKEICCFLDIDPINEGHVLIVPKKHIHNIDEVDDKILLKILNLSKKLTKVFKKTYNCDGYTMMQNGGIFTDFGHYHMHIFPRYKNDKFGWTCKEIINPESLENVKEKLQVELKSIK